MLVGRKGEELIQNGSDGRQRTDRFASRLMAVASMDPPRQAPRCAFMLPASLRGKLNHGRYAERSVGGWRLSGSEYLAGAVRPRAGRAAEARYRPSNWISRLSIGAALE